MPKPRPPRARFHRSRTAGGSLLRNVRNLTTEPALSVDSSPRRSRSGPPCRRLNTHSKTGAPRHPTAKRTVRIWSTGHRSSRQRRPRTHGCPPFRADPLPSIAVPDQRQVGYESHLARGVANLDGSGLATNTRRGQEPTRAPARWVPPRSVCHGRGFPEPSQRAISHARLHREFPRSL